MKHMWIRLLLIIIMAAQPLCALINPTFQPIDLYETHKAVIVGRIIAIDVEKGLVNVRIERVYKGEYTVGAIIEITAVAAMQKTLQEWVKDGRFKIGDPWVAMAGKTRASRAKEFVFFNNGFGLGKMEQPLQWSWADSEKELVDPKGNKISSMAGIWNGSTSMLARMVDDIAAGRCYFPRQAYAAFKPDILIDRLSAAVNGIAAHDFDGDGRLDVIVAGSEGDRIYFQKEPLVFVQASEWVGLDTASPSVAVGDINGDGRVEIILGAAVISLVEKDGRLRATRLEVLPDDADFEVKTVQLADLTNDGFPEIIINRYSGGVKAYRNPGAAGGMFTDMTSACGFAELAAKGDGFLTLGDWNNDGRVDLFHAVGTGVLLQQNNDGRFAAVSPDLACDFRSGEKRGPGLTGAATFVPLMDPGISDLVIPQESSWVVAANVSQAPVDITAYGNEISEGSFLHLATIAEDFTLDGHVDLFTISRAENGHNRLIGNRGYGSFMLAEVHKYYEHFFQGPSMERGGTAVTSGDLDGDGTPDILLGNSHGEIILIANETMALRKPVQHPTDDLAALQRMRVIPVDVAGLGSVGARVTLTDAAGTIHAQRVLSGTSHGSWPASTATLVTRLPGKYTVTVTYTDNKQQQWPVDVTETTMVRIAATRFP